jgi:hypothetical protein
MSEQRTFHRNKTGTQIDLLIDRPDSVIASSTYAKWSGAVHALLSISAMQLRYANAPGACVTELVANEVSVAALFEP